MPTHSAQIPGNSQVPLKGRVSLEPKWPWMGFSVGSSFVMCPLCWEYNSPSLVCSVRLHLGNERSFVERETALPLRPVGPSPRS